MEIQFEYFLRSLANDADMAKGSTPLTTITNPIQLTNVESESWYTFDDQHPLILTPPSGFVGGSRPRTHS